MKVSVIIGNIWFRIGYPDTGIWVYSTSRWVYNGRKQFLTTWKKLQPLQFFLARPAWLA